MSEPNLLRPDGFGYENRGLEPTGPTRPGKTLRERKRILVSAVDVTIAPSVVPIQ
ncbi:hypothetical protein [Caballeronia glebae]|uniref:hypothetical protein n=1 Tax=Caballeronia glebae TaxID=1777143 RepID=UPI0038B7724B